MAEIGWARGTGDFAAEWGLRRGEWYRVVEDSGAPWLRLDVNQVEVRITRDQLLVRRHEPWTWSVVRLTPAGAAVEAKRHGHANDEAHRTYLVCPGCHGRHHLATQPKELWCPQCGKIYPVDWSGGV